jgi:hypothetical protein
MCWNDAAVDMVEFSVHHISVSEQGLESYNLESPHRWTMGF